MNLFINFIFYFIFISFKIFKDKVIIFSIQSINNINIYILKKYSLQKTNSNYNRKCKKTLIFQEQTLSGSLAVVVFDFAVVDLTVVVLGVVTVVLPGQT